MNDKLSEAIFLSVLAIWLLFASIGMMAGLVLLVVGRHAEITPVVEVIFNWTLPPAVLVGVGTILCMLVGGFTYSAYVHYKEWKEERP